MRVNFKIFLLVAIGLVFYGTFLLWARCGTDFRNNSNGNNNFFSAVNQQQQIKDEDWKSILNSNTAGITAPQLEEIDCNINGDYTISCRKEGDEVYLPFSFIHKYFEIYGKVANYDGFKRFEWSHSYSKVHQPKHKYSTLGVFTYFENYKVEERDRVKCISGIEGVPVTTQWKPSGYFYPTQIAQFGLAHYSKNLTEPEPSRKLISPSHYVGKSWVVPKSAMLEHFGKNESIAANSNYLKFNTFGEEGLFLIDQFNTGFVLNLNMKLFSRDNSSMQVTLLDTDSKESWHLHYVCGSFFIKVKVKRRFNNIQSIFFLFNEQTICMGAFVPEDTLAYFSPFDSSERSLILRSPHFYLLTTFNVFHGIKCDEWTTLTRDLFIDLQKGLLALGLPKKKITRPKLKILEIKFFGAGLLGSITLSSSEHLKQFFAAAEWLVSYQNVTSGGWPNPVRRKLAPGFSSLEPGWYSAMGQGHAISLLSRAFYVSRNSKYLDAASRALKPFHLSTHNGGVLTSFMNQLAWYEEYPTQPSSFTLNGFIYSLIGLYDLMSVAPGDKEEEATLLFNEGMESLKKMLLLFDTGSGSMYDLRHLGLKTAPNLARWDYHATHVNQLFLLHTIHEDPLFLKTATRWQGYMKGSRAQHN